MMFVPLLRHETMSYSAGIEVEGGGKVTLKLSSPLRSTGVGVYFNGLSAPQRKERLPECSSNICGMNQSF